MPALVHSRADTRRVSTLARALVMGSLLSGCLEAVSLGSECPGRIERCDHKVEGPGDQPDGSRPPSMPPMGNIDSGMTNMQPGTDASLDAGTGAMADGSADASWSEQPDADGLDGGETAQFPALRNGSFELTRGRPGDIAYSPIDPLPLGTNLVEPWGACRSGFSALESSQGVLPRDGAVFVEADLSFIGVSGLRQTLATPMRGGTRYGFAIDLRASTGAELTLQVSASQVDCVAGVKLAESGRVSDQDWQRVCISFVPAVDTPQLLLQPVALGLDTSGRLYFDNLRDDPTCLY
jgi:hypothetical protein